MVLQNVKEETAIPIAEELFKETPWSEIKEKGVARNNHYIQLVRQEIDAKHIIQDNNGNAIIIDFTRITGKDIKPNGEKNKSDLTDEEYVKDRGGLGVDGKAVKTEGRVDTSSIARTQTEHLANEMNLVTWFGTYCLDRARKYVDLTDEEMKKPELATPKYIAWFDQSEILMKDPRALDRERAENVMARYSIKELTALLDLYKEGFEICASLICRSCRRKILQSLNMQAHARGIEVEIEQ